MKASVIHKTIRQARGLLALGSLLALAACGGTALTTMTQATSEPFAGLPALVVPAGYRLVWADEFNTDGLPDPAKWSFDTERNKDGWYNHERQYYSRDRVENALVQGGRLRITARKEALSGAPDWGGQPYTSARLLTRGKAAWTYGFFEVRAKLPCGKGTWPAIWTLGTGGRWPEDGELDILEQIGHRPDRIFSTVHMAAGFGGKGSGTEVGRPGVCDGFHNYQMLWTAGEIRFAMDGVVHHVYANPKTGNAAWPFDAPQYLLLNLAIGGDLGGEVDEGMFPRIFEIEYVRVYQAGR